jgi:hypothetical protein
VSELETQAFSKMRSIAPVVVVIVLLVAATAGARRFGYKVGGNVVVRCHDGHLFTTLWVPGASLTSIRLGWWRWQRCPVGQHWTLVSPVREADLSEAERETAARHHDVPLP